MDIHSILEEAHRSNGMLTSQRATELGIYRSMLSYLTTRGLLVREARGVYLLPATIGDAFFNAASRFRRGVFSHSTALFLHGLIDRTPHEMEMTFPKSYNTTSPRKCGIHCHRVSEDLVDIGCGTATTPGGHAVPAHSPERAICDVFKECRGTPSDEEISALRNLLRNDSTMAATVYRIAIRLRVDKTIRPYLEALT